jgi:hypothetical protein
LSIRRRQAPGRLGIGVGSAYNLKECLGIALEGPFAFTARPTVQPTNRRLRSTRLRVDIEKGAALNIAESAKTSAQLVRFNEFSQGEQDEERKAA